MIVYVDDDPLDGPTPAKRKSGDSIKQKEQTSKMKFSLNAKPKNAPLKISLTKPQVVS